MVFWREAWRCTIKWTRADASCCFIHLSQCMTQDGTREVSAVYSSSSHPPPPAEPHSLHEAKLAVVPKNCSCLKSRNKKMKAKCSIGKTEIPGLCLTTSPSGPFDLVSLGERLLHPLTLPFCPGQSCLWQILKKNVLLKWGLFSWLCLHSNNSNFCSPGGNDVLDESSKVIFWITLTTPTFQICLFVCFFVCLAWARNSCGTFSQYSGKRETPS